MVGMPYASVPLYRLFCEKTGFDGTTNAVAAAPGRASARPSVTVSFSADVNVALPLAFYPPQRKIEARLGEPNTAIFIAENLSDHPITGTATFNVAARFGSYFVKIQCFCFTQQTLNPGERVEMPVVFFVDPAFGQDPQLDRMSDVTLSLPSSRPRCSAPASEQARPDTPAAGGAATSSAESGSGRSDRPAAAFRERELRS